MVDAESDSNDDGSYDGDGDMYTASENSPGGSILKRKADQASDVDSPGEETERSNLRSKKKRKLRKENETKKLHKPPTVEELNRLRETENLFHSNLFRRQIEEMLAELEIKDKFQVRVNAWLEKFNDWLSKMEDGEEKFDLSNREWLESLKIPIPIERNMKGWYQFKKPPKASIVGSYATKTMLGPGNVDIIVEMPGSFFQKEDYLNCRYLVKRSIYLSELTRHFQLMGNLVQDIRYVCEEGNNCSPLLEIVPSGKLSKTTIFTIYLTSDRMNFKKLSRFSPSKNNVRPNWFYADEKIETEDSSLTPTPKYNSAILRDLRMAENENFLRDTIGKSNQLRDAVVLVKVWLKQRELNVGHGGFSGFLVSMLISYLLHIRKLNLTMSSYQILRCVWNFLSSSDLARNGITLCETSGSEPLLSEFHDQFPLVFVDPSGFLNLCAGMSPLVFQRCKDESELALRYLDSHDSNSFQNLFMRPAPFSMLCDHSIIVHTWKKFDKLVETNSTFNKKLDFCGTLYPQVCDTVVGLVQKGLGERVQRIFLKQLSRKQWSVSKKPPRSSSLTLGLILDPDHCFAMVDKGPIEDSKKAQEFRDFWQGRSELRRFKDGSITEAVVWKAETWEEKRLICRQVIDYIFKSKLGLENADFKYIADELQNALSKNSETQSANVLSEYEELVKLLKDLPSLPLDIISVQGISPVFRHSELYPPTLPHLTKKNLKAIKNNRIVKKVVDNCEVIDVEAIKVPSWCAPAEMVIQLGSSNKWPHDLEAVRRIRAAFNLKIAGILHRKHNFVSHAYQDYTDVLGKSCVFRLRIAYPGEIVLMKKTQTADGLLQYVDTEESLKLERRTLHLPKITSALRGLHSQNSSLGLASCLAKRWVRAHLFDESHISDVAIDLLMASVYLNPEPWNPPHQPQLAFLRFLYLLGHTNWSLDFVLLNFNEELKKDEISAIRSFFDTNRMTLPPLFIASSYDRDRSIWTRDGPIPVVFLRLINLCRLAHSILTTQLYAKTALDIQSLFQPSLGAFDVLITLNALYIPKRQKLDANMVVEDNPKSIPVVGFDSVGLYVKELRESYGEWALFFYDPYIGTVIGVVWKPSIKEARDVKVSHLYGRYLDEKTNKLHVNVNAMLEGFAALGTKLVKRVDVREGEKLVKFQI